MQPMHPTLSYWPIIFVASAFFFWQGIADYSRATKLTKALVPPPQYFTDPWGPKNKLGDEELARRKEYRRNQMTIEVANEMGTIFSSLAAIVFIVGVAMFYYDQRSWKLKDMGGRCLQKLGKIPGGN